MNKQEKANFILAELKKVYPTIGPMLNHESVFQLLIAVILSAQSTDKQINKLTPELFKHYPTPEKMAVADIDHLKELVKSSGFYNNKAKNIKATAEKIVKDFNGKVPDNMDDLQTLPGVARKTANVLMHQGFGNPQGIAIDTHMIRLTNLLGLTESKNPVVIEKNLMKLFPKKEWGYISTALITYGREFCSARKHDSSKCFLLPGH